MSADEEHRCTVQLRGDGTPYLAFEPSSGEISSYSNSLFTIELRREVDVEDARWLATMINQRLWGVSTTIF
jgi:hypothetical protein